MQVIRPDKWRQRYLARWIAGNYSTRLLGRPLLIQLALTLPAHDRFSDALRAVRPFCGPGVKRPANRFHLHL